MPDASRLTPPLRVVGHNVQRVDGLEKVTGASQYVADIRLPGMLEARVLRSPYPHARILHVDTSKARQLPGVYAVVTGEDTPKRKWGAFQQDQYVLAVDKVRYVGDEVAAVAAVDEATAKEALGLIQVDYEELPAVFDPTEAMAPGAPQIHDEKPANIALHFKIQRGDPDGALARAHLVLEDSFETQMQWHAAIETIGSVAQFSPRGKLTLWMNCATIFMARARIAWALGLDLSDVRVIQTAVGGAFGGKSCDDNNAMICGLMAMRAGRPVRLINTRAEEFLASRPRPAMKIWVRMGFLRDGTITGKDLRVIVDNGAYAAKGVAVGGVAALRHDGMFLYRDVRSELYVVHTNKVATGAFRGFGNPDAAFAIDQMIDMGAEALGLDPVEVALKNMIEANHTSVHGQEILSCGLKDCVRQAARMIGWSEKRPHDGDRGSGVGARGARPHPSPLPEGEGVAVGARLQPSPQPLSPDPQALALSPQPLTPDPQALALSPQPLAPSPQPLTPGPRRGLGMASSIHVSGKRHFGDFDGASVLINVNLDGKVHIWSGEGETGPGATTVFAQMAAEELGVRYEDVSVSQADTDTTTYAQGSYGSRTTYVAGSAVRDGARQVKDELLETAAEMLEVAAEDLEIADGVISVRGAPGTGSVTVAEVAHSRLYRRGGKPISTLGTWDPPSRLQDAERYGNESGAYNFCSHAIEVEVDPETGQFTILNYVAASDAGTVVFPMGAEGQNEGGIAQGIGYASIEGMLLEDGRPLTPNLSDYRIPCIADMPPLQQVFVPSHEPTGPFGAKGIGEIGLDPAAPALANAIYDAVGVRIKTLPITPEKILRALQNPN